MLVFKIRNPAGLQKMEGKPASPNQADDGNEHETMNCKTSLFDMTKTTVQGTKENIKSPFVSIEIMIR